MHKLAEDILHAALNAVNAKNCVAAHLTRTGNRLLAGKKEFDLSGFENIHVIGAGKATAHMAAAVESILEDRITSGIITVKYDHTVPLKIIRTIEAGHPVPDENGVRGAHLILETAKKAGEKDLVICLLSGGGSALMPLAAPGLSLAEKQETIRHLLACGAAIEEINAIRKHLSAIKGGQLAKAAAPATMITLIVSDVVGDKLDVIASGPTVEDTSTFALCLEIIKKYELAGRLPEPAVKRIRQGANHRVAETPKPGELNRDKLFNLIVAGNFAALCAAAGHARLLGYNTLILSSMIEGYTTETARFHAAIAKQVSDTSHPAAPPACIISGGETTVRIQGNGLGGRNQEFCLATAIEIQNHGNIVILCAGTDGTDGPTDAAGAIVDSGTIRRAAELGLDAKDFLMKNDSYHFFKQTGELLVTGPTGTNVMDMRIMLIGKPVP
ncbi:MAG: glycerate kinase [Desulfobacteraceae bacterium]|nr:glycerate kinase [Desulfobacteraceae bacterium]